MNLIGDLERVFATNLYPLRVPIVIALVTSAFAVTLVARRRGWFAAARRHPRRSGTALVIVLAFGLPVAWYLASPIFIRTELIEPASIAVADGGAEESAASTSAPPVSAPDPPTASEGRLEPSITPIPQPSTFVPRVLAAGTFHGADDFHFGEGSASIIETAPSRFTLRFDDFSVRNGPDLYVYLSPDPVGYGDGVVELGTLKATDGAFGYELPEGTDPAEFASAVIWCKQFAVQFAVAPFGIF